MNTGQLLILVEQENITVPRPSSVGLHHGFMLTPSQMRRAMERLTERGIDMTCDREITRGDYSIELYDPDGHHVQIEPLDSVQAKEVILPGVGIVDCGLADSYQVGDVKLFKDGEFFLVRVAEGFFALSRWCRHFNGRVIWRQEHWHFYCPYHSATYDRCGAPTLLTQWGGRFRDLPPLRLNAISFGPDGHVLVDTDQVIDRDHYDPSQAAQLPGA